MELHQEVIQEIKIVTDRIIERSKPTRDAYLALIASHASKQSARQKLAAANQAHTYAACPMFDKGELIDGKWPNIGIVTAYNDMLSAHEPLGEYPDIIKAAVRKHGAVAQVAGGVPAMCDGITQGFEGMDLSLFSRDVIAMATAISMSHNVFDAGICLGVCDKIVPGLMIGALRFGWLPFIFSPAGPMPSGITNTQKSKNRQLYVEGKITPKQLLESESAAYHAAGTCTFYGTANSNQMMMEFMGMHLANSAFVPPNTTLRTALVRAVGVRASRITQLGDEYIPIGHVISEKSIVNAIVGLCATGGSTNHMLHLPAIARAAGIIIDWQDFEDISEVTPLLARVYPNGGADVNRFQDAGGIAFLIRELLAAGLLHDDVMTVMGHGLHNYTQEPFLDGDLAVWQDGTQSSRDLIVLRPYSDPFDKTGGLRLVKGNIGRGCVKISAVSAEHHEVIAPARVFTSQVEFHDAFERGELNRDVVVVVRGQGPKANGMPELHKLTPSLGILQDKGFNVALLTDGRMSGASGKVLAAIHITPETLDNGAIGKIRDGDLLKINAAEGVVEALVEKEIWDSREIMLPEVAANHIDIGRELFGVFRQNAGGAEQGASQFKYDGN